MKKTTPKDYLADNELVLHPGGNMPPLCQRCETRYQTAVDQKQITSEKGVLLVLGRGSRYSMMAQEVDITHKPHTERSEPNGLVQEGPFKGYWAHNTGKVDAAGRPIFFLGRPNTEPTSYGKTEVHRANANPDKWKEVLTRIRGDTLEYPTYWVGVEESSTRGKKGKR